MRIKFYVKRVIAIVALTLIYSFSWLVSILFGKIIRSRSVKNRVIINCIFHNPNWFYAHVAPICQSGYGEVILICDEEIDPLPNLRYDIPPKWMMRLFTRAGAKFIWTIKTGICYPADVFVGYHIFPSAVTTLIAARLTGGKAIYQSTGGQLESEGGGWNAENQLLNALGKPSKWIETLALAMINQFDCVIVRGQNAKTFILDGGYRNRLEVVTGSVLTDATLMQETRDIDILLVGRLSEYKRPDRFLNVVADVVKDHPKVKVAIAGDGPDRQALESQAKDLEIQNNVEFLGQRSDVPNLMGRAKLFVLTSRWEGVSIAMLEAMALAVVPVVSDVGDLRDFARANETGFVIPEDDLPAFSKTLSDLLADEGRRAELGKSARALILQTCDRDLLSKRWKQIITEVAA